MSASRAKGKGRRSKARAHAAGAAALCLLLGPAGCASTATTSAPPPAATPQAVAVPAEQPAPSAPPAAPEATLAAAPTATPPAAPVTPSREPALVSLTAAIDAIASRPGVSRGTWGIAVESLARSERLYEHNGRTLMVPASVAKLVSVSAAVDAVGWNYSFETLLRATGPVVNGVLQGDLIIVGSGDPSIGGRGGDDFAAWVAALRAAGITRINGRIIGDDNAFEDPRPGAMWAWDDLGYTSGALFGALNFAENRMAVTATPAATANQPVALAVEPHASDRPLMSRALTGPRGSMALLWPEQRPGETFLTIAGSLPVGAAPVRMSVSAGNPTFWFASVFRNRLIRDGIEVTGGAIDIDDLERLPDTTAATTLFTYRSPPLASLTQPLLKDSINLYAEAVLRLSTGLTGGRTNDDALAAIQQRLPSWGLEPGALQVVDGSGLSRRDSLAADTLVAILKRMYDPAGTSPWMSGLPIAGVDGTLMNRLRGTAAQGKVRAKSGTMSNIRSLAGYTVAANGEPIAFAIMLNNFEGTSAEANAAIDAIVLKLVEFTR